MRDPELAATPASRAASRPRARRGEHDGRRRSDDTDRTALYIRLTRVFRDRILSGEWPDGHRLPPIPDLCREYDVAPITVRQALKPLIEDGWIEAARGKGTFVTGTGEAAHEDPALRAAINDHLTLGPEQDIRILSRRRRAPLPAELKVEGGLDEYARVDKIHRHRGIPFAMMSVFVAPAAYERFPKGAERQVKLFRLFCDQGGIALRRGRQLTTICHADRETARRLECSFGGVLVRMRAWWFDTKGKLVFAGLFLYRGDMFALDRYDEFPNLSPIPQVREEMPSRPEARPRRATQKTGPKAERLKTKPQKPGRKM